MNSDCRESDHFAGIRKGVYHGLGSRRMEELP